MNTNNIHGLSWFPNFPEKFVTWGQEINLYEIRSKDDNFETTPKNRFQNIGANFLTTETRYQYARCVLPSYHKEYPIIAVGLGDGKIGICNFHETVDSSWEYTPRQQRMCQCLAWNELDPNILAIGHDRHRSDSCITIWDIELGIPKETANFFGHSESANSICWDRNQRVLITGMSQKQIKLFDLRQSNATCQSIQTKAVNGLAVAPNGYYLCSFVDSSIVLWDSRSIQKPLKHIQSGKNHLQLSWCTTRSSLLCSLQRESPYLTFYDMRSVEVEKIREVYHLKKQLLPFPNKQLTNKTHTLTSLSWHPYDYERALIISETGNIIDFRIPSYILTAYNNRQKLPLGLQHQSITPITPTLPISHSSQSNTPDLIGMGNGINIEVLDADLIQNDLVALTRQRALNDYGLKVINKRYADLFLSDYLKNVWLCLNNVYRDKRFTGLKTVLGIGMGHTSEAFMNYSRVESQILQWPEFINNSSNLVCYRSEQRDSALGICGWRSEQYLDNFITTLCDYKEFSRAAMIAVFHLKILLACDILSKAAEVSTDSSMFRIAAIALSGFNADRCSTAWRNQRSNANMQIQDPHLRAIFSFLTIENENYDSVLLENGISLADRIAFACKYLSESKLADYIRQQIQNSTENGDLNGLLLTGESVEGINILQAYMDTTFDIQTVAVIAINYFHNNFNHKQIQNWISSYLDCLQSWGLWEKRSNLEIKIENLRAFPRQSRNVFLSCNFCGKSVSNALQEHSDARLRNASSNVNKLSSCPSCRKPLPRCSLCLLHMGTTFNSSNVSKSGHDSLGWQSKPFSKWFSWCQTCRHGGHTEHIMQWFKQNAECPVSSCSCRCFDLDALKPNTGQDL